MMDKMTDSKAVEVLSAWIRGENVQTETFCTAVAAAIARLREPAEAQAQGGGEVVAWTVFDAKGVRFTLYNRELAEAIAERGLLVLPMRGSYEWFDAKIDAWKPIDRLPYTWERELGIQWRERTAPPSAPGCGACADGCKDRGSCRVRDESPPSAPVGVEVDALIRLVEGPGCLRWQDGQGFRLKDTQEWMAFYVAAKNALTQQPAAREELSPDFTDSARAAIAWVLYHHQGGSSPVGQPLRFALGMGAAERLPEWRIAEAKRWAEWAGSTTADFHRQQPAAVDRCPRCGAVRRDYPCCPLPDQQPAAVDEAMARRLDDYLGGEFDIRIGKQAAHAALCHALHPTAAQEKSK